MKKILYSILIVLILIIGFMICINRSPKLQKVIFIFQCTHNRPLTPLEISHMSTGQAYYNGTKLECENYWTRIQNGFVL